jgi:hypothetical protein
MPCDWPVDPCGKLPELDDPQYPSLSESAGNILWALSGRQFGCCETTKMLCSAGCEPSQEDVRGPASPWVVAACRSCQGLRPCQHGGPTEVYLPGPVCEMLEVTVAGEGVVPTGSYRVDDLCWLVRTDGGDWPAGARPGDWTVTYATGTPVPAGGRRAKGELMSEMWKACCGDKDCQLPKRVQVLVRQGVTFGTLDAMKFLQEGKTGLYFTDLWLSTVNPLGRRAAARVSSVDWEPGRTTTWP